MGLLHWHKRGEKDSRKVLNLANVDHYSGNADVVILLFKAADVPAAQEYRTGFRGLKIDIAVCEDPVIQKSRLGSRGMIGADFGDGFVHLEPGNKELVRDDGTHGFQSVLHLSNTDKYTGNADAVILIADAKDIPIAEKHRKLNLKGKTVDVAVCEDPDLQESRIGEAAVVLGLFEVLAAQEGIPGVHSVVYDYIDGGFKDRKVLMAEFRQEINSTDPSDFR